MGLRSSDIRSVVSSAWGGMLALLLAMLVLDPLRYAMEGRYSELTVLLRRDPGPLGLQVLVVALCLNALVQVAVHVGSGLAARRAILALSVLYGLFFLGHHVVHLLHGEPLGIQSLLDVTHHALALAAVWGSWRWMRDFRA